MFIVRCTGENINLNEWRKCQIGFDTGRRPVDGWKMELLEKAGIDFDLDRVRAAINDIIMLLAKGWWTGQV